MSLSFPVARSTGTSSVFFGFLINEEIYGVGEKGLGGTTMIGEQAFWSPF